MSRPMKWLLYFAGVLAFLFLIKTDDPVSPPTAPAPALADSALQRALDSLRQDHQGESDSAAIGRRWKVSTDASEMDGSSTVTLMLDAETELVTWTKKVTPTLVIRCKERRFQVYVITNSPGHVEYDHSDEARVRVRFGEGQPRAQWWGESTDNEAIFAPNGQDFAFRATRDSVVRLEFTPFNQSPQVIRFDVRGLTAVLPQVLDACRIKHEPA